MSQLSSLHPVERSGGLQFVMVVSFIMTFVFLGADWAEGRLAALMSFAWFLVSFALYVVSWLLHGHALWRSGLEDAGDIEVDQAE